MIRTLKPRLKTLPPRLSSPRAIRDTRFSVDAKVRGWYHSKRWADLRLEVLVRDMWTCQRTGVLLTGKAPADNSPVIHHKIAHLGDEYLFWHKGNLEAVSKAWHDSEAQRAERSAPV